MSEVIKIPRLEFPFQFTDVDTGAPLFGGVPAVLEKIHQCLTLSGWKVLAGTVNSKGEWSLQVGRDDGQQHNFVFGPEITQIILEDSILFDKVYQMISQLVQMFLFQKFAEIRKGMTTS